ncbi:MAG: hypothetical protein NT092_02355, partial [Bacteroidia bacterium]|nr:hypothetical protein [Bacteroidia bacterium]
MNNFTLLLFFTLIFTSSPAQDKNSVSEFRGKGRTGIYQESNLLKVWPAAGPVELWTVDNIGNGFVSPVF